MLLLGYSISIFMHVHMSISAFNTDFNESIYFYDGYTYAIAVIHFLSFSLYIYEHDRLYIWIYILRLFQLHHEYENTLSGYLSNPGRNGCCGVDDC